MNVDWSVSIWDITSHALALVGAMVAAYHVLDKRMAVFEQIVKEHERTLAHHSATMDRHDALILELVGQVQQLVGRLKPVGT